jgi:hypothetical protein
VELKSNGAASGPDTGDGPSTTGQVAGQGTVGRVAGGNLRAFLSLRAAGATGLR